MRKLLKVLLLVFFFFIGILIAKNKIIPSDQFSLFQGYKQNFYENVQIGDMEILKVEEKQPLKSQIGVVYVPQHWKYGVNTQTTEYLEGYVPNIRSFREYWDIHINLMYGINPFTEKFSIEDMLTKFETDNSFYFSKGIENESSFFEWNSENCSTVYSDTLKSSLFVCDTWVNWIPSDLDSKSFVLTSCSLDKENGYCIFEDYLKLYYESKRYGESRCFGESELYCDYEKYLDIVSLN